MPAAVATGSPGHPRVLGIATQGQGGNDEARLAALLQGLDVTLFPFDRKAKGRSFAGLLKALRAMRPGVAVMEGTGVAGGLAVLLARWLFRIPYVVSSGDAVRPFIAARYPYLSVPAGVYESLLCRNAAGFIGWTPYLSGRALSLGAPRAMTAPGWAPFESTPAQQVVARERIRRELGIPPDALVVGIIGSLAWSPRVGYCYGHELIRALRFVRRKDLRVLVIGDGDGRARLVELAGRELDVSAHIIGSIPRNVVADYLSAMDIASLPQSVDGVGSFRYTTKLAEYVAAGLPIITTRIPLAYDLDDGWIWRLPGRTPWDEQFVRALAKLLDEVTPEDIAAKRRAVPTGALIFNRHVQQERAAAFLADICDGSEY